jgi:hypothetical protein
MCFNLAYASQENMVEKTNFGPNQSNSDKITFKLIKLGNPEKLAQASLEIDPDRFVLITGGNRRDDPRRFWLVGA